MCKYIQPPFFVNTFWFPPPLISMAISLKSRNEPQNVINLDFTKPSLISWHISGWKIYAQFFCTCTFYLTCSQVPGKNKTNQNKKQAAILNAINRQKMAALFQMLVCTNLHDGGLSLLNKTRFVSCTKTFFNLGCRIHQREQFTLANLPATAADHVLHSSFVNFPHRPWPLYKCKLYQELNMKPNQLILKVFPTPPSFSSGMCRTWNFAALKRASEATLIKAQVVK